MLYGLRILLITFVTIEIPVEGFTMLAIPDAELGECEDSKFPFPGDEYVDLGNLEFIQIDDETIIMNGTVITKFKFSEVPLKVTIKTQYETRGDWSDGHAQYLIESFCPRMFLPSEPWYSITSKLQGDERTCPPKPGTVYHLNEYEISSKMENLPKIKGGHWRAIVEVSQLSVLGKETGICFIFSAVMEELYDK